MAQRSINRRGDALVPLREWIEGEGKKQISAEKKHKPEIMILRCTTVAYGVAELLRHVRDHPCQHSPANSLSEQCSVDNFVVRTICEATASTSKEGRNSQSTWNDIKGVNMISPGRSMNIYEPLFLCSSISGGSEGQEDQITGRYLEVDFPTLSDKNNRAPGGVSQNEEDVRCHSLGILLYELFAHLSPALAEGPSEIVMSNKRAISQPNEVVSQEQAYKKIRLLNSKATSVTEIPSCAHVLEDDHETAQAPLRMLPLLELGCPAPICLVVQNLIERGEDNRPDKAYDSLDEVKKDLHLLLLDPSRFLFGCVPSSENGRTKLSFREHKLYGRETEVSSITDAFCRVSTGKNEAFFIAGFSGSGKSMLVNSLRAQVDISGGYVLTHKFDQMSKEKPLLEVISAFNDLCPIIRDRSSQEDLHVIVKNLMDVFGTDFSVLARLLPKIKCLFPQPNPAKGEKESGDQMNLRSICFTLQRFMRSVSSKSHPVMLFLDDLQWCDNSALSLVEGILTDEIGSGCLFFVGSYRSNEVQDDHEIFHLMESLQSSGVPTTSISLEGLKPEDLNNMISDALCMFPRICEPLSDIVFQKTKGNPFFVIAFLRSLIDRGLLAFCRTKMRWIWDEDHISSEDITGNVLYLLSSKMSGLSDNIQSALKVAACFGIKIKDSVVEYLSTNSEYSGIRDGLKQVMKEGFMIQVGNSEFKFVHDKVREAAYSLITESERGKHHYRLGMALFSVTKGGDFDDVIFDIADQINHGKEPIQSPALRIDLIKLYETAGVKAVDCSDYETSRSYLTIALSLLPTDHWESQYDLSLRLSFLWAKSAYSCADVEKAQDILQEILGKCRCIQDKLPSYFLLVTIIHSCGDARNAYSTCQEVLSQLDEEIQIPLSLDPKEMTKIMDDTLKLVKDLSEVNILEMKEMDRKHSISLKFLSLMATISYLTNPEISTFITCKMVQITMSHGVCNHSIMGFVQYAAMICTNKKGDIQCASRVGRAAISCYKKRFQSSGYLPKLFYAYYGFLAFHTEPFQSCAGMLRQGFDAGMSLGESETAFLNAVQHIKISLCAGEQLHHLLKRVDYYISLADLYKNDLTKAFMSIFRGTISTLIDKGESTSSKNHSNDSTMENVMKLPNSRGAMYFHRAIQAYWLGHSERCHHYVAKALQVIPITKRIQSYMILFIQGLNCFQMLKRNNTAKLRSLPRNSIAQLKTATSDSRWNFRNKVHLLEAENFSFLGKNEEAKASYTAAITSAQCSRFVQEQGLACELAGQHYKKIGDNLSALTFLNHAKQCYAEWGSKMKLDDITRQLESFPIISTAGNTIV